MIKNAFHILVVDDDDKIRDLVKQYLEEHQFLVTTAKDAKDAKKKLEIIKFDILILDIMMPGESGLSLTREIKKNNPTPIILLTARGTTQDRIEGLELGADDYLGKPFEPKELLLRIKNKVILVKKGETDARQRLIFLNEKGKNLFNEIFLEQKKRIYNALKNSDSDSVIKFKNVLSKIIND